MDLIVTIGSDESIDRLNAWAMRKSDTDPENPLSAGEKKAEDEKYMKVNLREEILLFERRCAWDEIPVLEE